MQNLVISVRRWNINNYISLLLLFLCFIIRISHIKGGVLVMLLTEDREHRGWNGYDYVIQLMASHSFVLSILLSPHPSPFPPLVPHSLIRFIVFSYMIYYNMLYTINYPVWSNILAPFFIMVHAYIDTDFTFSVFVTTVSTLWLHNKKYYCFKFRYLYILTVDSS